MSFHQTGGPAIGLLHCTPAQILSLCISASWTEHARPPNGKLCSEHSCIAELAAYILLERSGWHKPPLTLAIADDHLHYRDVKTETDSISGSQGCGRSEQVQAYQSNPNAWCTNPIWFQEIYLLPNVKETVICIFRGRLNLVENVLRWTLSNAMSVHHHMPCRSCPRGDCAGSTETANPLRASPAESSSGWAIGSSLLALYILVRSSHSWLLSHNVHAFVIWQLLCTCDFAGICTSIVEPALMSLHFGSPTAPDHRPGRV